MDRLNYFGIGPKIGIATIPLIALTIYLSSNKYDFFGFTKVSTNTILIMGIAMMVVGLVFYTISVKFLIKGIKETRLLTTGTFYLCQNPAYSAYLLFLIPATSLIFNSWLILSASIIGFIIFKIFIKNEYKELEKVFGEEYLKYKRMTPEFFPFPLGKWFSNAHRTTGDS